MLRTEKKNYEFVVAFRSFVMNMGFNDGDENYDDELDKDYDDDDNNGEENNNND